MSKIVTYVIIAVGVVILLGIIKRLRGGGRSARGRRRGWYSQDRHAPGEMGRLPRGGGEPRESGHIESRTGWRDLDTSGGDGIEIERGGRGGGWSGPEGGDWQEIKPRAGRGAASSKNRGRGPVIDELDVRIDGLEGGSGGGELDVRIDGLEGGSGGGVRGGDPMEEPDAFGNGSGTGGSGDGWTDLESEGEDRPWPDDPQDRRRD